MVVRRLVSAIDWRLRRFTQKLAGHRTLLFHRWTPVDGVRIGDSGAHVHVVCLTDEQFRELEWSGNRYVFSEAHDFRGTGERYAFAGFTETAGLVGFCWLETVAADLRFFDLEVPLPSHVGYLSRVWVDPASRGRGIARSLVLALQASAVEHSLTSLLGACVPQNGGMRRVFSLTGWQPSVRVDRYFATKFSCFRVEEVGGARHWMLSQEALGVALSRS